MAATERNFCTTSNLTTIAIKMPYSKFLYMKICLITSNLSHLVLKKATLSTKTTHYANPPAMEGPKPVKQRLCIETELIIAFVISILPFCFKADAVMKCICHIVFRILFFHKCNHELLAFAHVLSGRCDGVRIIFLKHIQATS